MAASNESLIQKEQTELEAAPFFPDFDLPEIDKGKPRFHCTGERLFRDRRDVYDALIKLLAEPGVSVRTICRELHVSDHTVRSVAEREKIPIATVKKQVLSNIAHGLRLASERVIEVMPDASPRDALVGVGILGEKMQLLSGDVTARIDMTQSVNWREELRNLQMEAMAKLDSMKRVQAVETGDVGENISPNALSNCSEFQTEEVRQLQAAAVERLDALEAVKTASRVESRAGEAI